MKYIYRLLSKKLLWISAIALCSLPISLDSVIAQIRNRTPYQPMVITTGTDINDVLTDKDIPTGQKGFARDYAISAIKDERLEITVNAGGFDTVLSLLDS